MVYHLGCNADERWSAATGDACEEYDKKEIKSRPEKLSMVISHKRGCLNKFKLIASISRVTLCQIMLVICALVQANAINRMEPFSDIQEVKGLQSNTACPAYFAVSPHGRSQAP